MREYTIKTIYYSGYGHNNIKIFNILNLSDVLNISKFLKAFHAEYISVSFPSREGSIS